MKPIAMAVVCFVATFAGAATYTWTGSADGNWSNAANWDENGIPAVNADGSVYGQNTITIKKGKNQPATDVPTLPNNRVSKSSVPLFVIEPGASLSLNGFSTNNVDAGAQNVTQVTVGTGASLTWVVSAPRTSINLGRNAGTQTYNINGTLTFDTSRLNMGYQDGNLTLFNLDGGTVNATRVYGTRTTNKGDFAGGRSLVILNNGSHFNASGAFYQMEAGSAGSNPVLVFDIQDTASSVTAKYASSKGAAFADFAAVQAGLGTFFTSTTLGNGNLVATDNGTTFTVTAKAAGKP